jgi:hypothetical protein
MLWGLGVRDGRSPFPGLRALGVEDHRVFFGHGGEVEQRWLSWCGLQLSGLRGVPSGCGKSSLVWAGLLHVMAGEPGWWVLAPMLAWG